MRASYRLFAVLAAAVCLTAAASIPASAHTGTHHLLWASRWDLAPGGDYQAWMTLSTDKHICGVCSDWVTPLNNMVADWNGSATTVFMSVEASHQDNNQVHLITESNSNVTWLGKTEGQYLSGGSYVNCADKTDCSWDKVRVRMNDYTHEAFQWCEPSPPYACQHPYDTAGQYRGTAAHEVGHAFSLAHETNSCGEGSDNKPATVMSYKCIDPTVLGGSNINVVQNFDDCGVNHAYYDPNWGYSGCT